VAASVFVFQIDGVETKFLLANSIAEFSHGLGHQRHFKQNPRTSASPRIPDILLRRTWWMVADGGELTSAKLPGLLRRKDNRPQKTLAPPQK
jgi:hypothetical protein